MVTEAELAKPLIPWLEAQHWTVYQEVQCSMYGAVADIVALQGNLSWVIEVKRSLTFALIEQATQWHGRARFVSVAVPSPKTRAKGRRIAENLLEQMGIGLILIGDENWREPNQVIGPALRRRLYEGLAIAKFCTEQHKTWAEAGTAGSDHWTPFQQTARDVCRYVGEHPGCSLKELVDGIDHHYNRDATARSCLARWLREGVIKGVRVEQAGRAIKLYREAA